MHNIIHEQIANEMRRLTAELRALAKRAGPGPQGCSANTLATQMHALELAWRDLAAEAAASAVSRSTAN